jgi:mycofactocin system glycosyltransferase
VLFGGSPLRVLRLTASGARAVADWWAGAPVGPDPGKRRLARRLLDAGLAHPEPPASADLSAVTAVVPVRDRPEELRRCLAALASRCAVIVVDDGSEDADATAQIARGAGASLLRLDTSQGPAAARNAGLREVATPFVAFVDSDCVVGPDFPARLLDHLADKALAVAAPRIVGLPEPGPGLLAAYEARHSSLDMGPREGLVRVGTAVPYVPSAALVARVDALGEGFAAELRVGEDVDLLWRLGDAGWQVRYDPAVTVAHDHRVTWRRWFERRVVYNTSNATLMRRHPGTVPALTISRGGAAVWGAAAAGMPAAALVVGAVDAALLARRLRAHVPGAYALAASLAARRGLHEGRHLARALTGPWLPFLAVLTFARPRVARRLWAGALAGALWEWFEAPCGPTPLHYLAPRAAEDLARCLGIWSGCLDERDLRALLPRLR